MSRDDGLQLTPLIEDLERAFLGGYVPEMPTDLIAQRLVDAGWTRPGEHTLPPGAYLASALEAANIPCDSGEDVDRLIGELGKRGWALTRLERLDPLAETP